MSGGLGALVGVMASRNLEESFLALQERRQAARAKGQEVGLVEELGNVRRENDRLRLHLACVIALLIRKKLITKAEFGKLASIIDRADGVADGRFSGSIKQDGSLSADADYDDLPLRELAQAVQSIR